jgi:hypothetical protein
VTALQLISLVLAVVGSSVGAAWAICTRLLKIEHALTAHIVDETHKRQALTGRVIKLEKYRKRQQGVSPWSE